VDVTVLYFDGCPSWQTALERLRTASTRTRVPVQVSTRAVETMDEAEHVGFTGSPTILVNGVDPFAQAGQSPALACRVYATPYGLAGSPTVDQLVVALTAATA
jgi:hypothetical protein